MKDITAIEIRKITREANDAIPYSESKYPYLDIYENMNNQIIDKANKGENSISFDFVDRDLDEKKSFEEIKKEENRIYAGSKGGQAIHYVYDYPNYLIAKGFNVEIRKSSKQHGYVSKSYYISW